MVTGRKCSRKPPDAESTVPRRENSLPTNVVCTNIRPVPGLMDLVGIIVILIIVFGATVLPRTGELIGRRIAKSRGLPLPPKDRAKQSDKA